MRLGYRPISQCGLPSCPVAGRTGSCLWRPLPGTRCACRVFYWMLADGRIPRQRRHALVRWTRATGFAGRPPAGAVPVAHARCATVPRRRLAKVRLVKLRAAHHRLTRWGLLRFQQALVVGRLSRSTATDRVSVQCHPLPKNLTLLRKGSSRPPIIQPALADPALAGRLHCEEMHGPTLHFS